MHSGGHARKRIDFYILLCGIWCFPPFTFFFSPFFCRQIFLILFFIFLSPNSSWILRLRIAYKKATGRVCGGRWKGGGGASGTCLASAASAAVTATATARPLPDVSLSNRIQQFYDAPSVQQQQRERGGAAQLKWHLWEWQYAPFRCTATLASILLRLLHSLNSLRCRRLMCRVYCAGHCNDSN